MFAQKFTLAQQGVETGFHEVDCRGNVGGNPAFER
jgi:hypothetical protein